MFPGSKQCQGWSTVLRVGHTHSACTGGRGQGDIVCVQGGVSAGHQSQSSVRLHLRSLELSFSPQQRRAGAEWGNTNINPPRPPFYYQITQP